MEKSHQMKSSFIKKDKQAIRKEPDCYLYIYNEVKKALNERATV